MTTETSAEQRLFRETNAEFIEESASVPQTRALWKEGKSFERDWWQQATELGWTSLLVPEELGGGSASGEGVLDLVSVAQLIGRHVSPGPLNVVSTAIAGLVHPAASGEHEELLEGLMTGETIASWAVHGTGAAWNPLAPTVTAAKSGSGWKLDGTATSVEFGAESDVILVVASTGDGVVELVVPTDAAGLTVTPTGSVDFVRKFAELSFAGVEVGPEAVVAEGAAAAEVVTAQARLMNVLQVNESVGALDRVFEFTLQWGFDRYSFGRPLVDYQALKHRYADDFVHLQQSQAIAAAAARALQQGSSSAAELISSAKSYVGDEGVQIVQSSAQLHGGLSQTLDHDVNVYLRRVMLGRNLYGTPREHRVLVADLINDEEKKGAAA